MSSLHYRATDSLEESYYDDCCSLHDFPNDRFLSVWKPRLLDNEYRIMYVATNSRDADGHSPPAIVVKEKEDSDGKALAKPVHFEVVWTNRDNLGGRDGQIYKAVAPQGYRALSDVAIHRRNSSMSPGDLVSADEIDPKFRCVHKSLVVSQELGDLKWKATGSVFTYIGIFGIKIGKSGTVVGVWDITGSAGFKTETYGKRPPNQQWRLDYIPSPLYKRMVVVDTFENPKNATKAVEKTFTYTVGTTVSSETSSSISAGISSTIGAKVSAGVPGVSNTEASMEITAFMNATTSFTTSETGTETVENSVKYWVDPGTCVTLWQLRVSDSKDGNVGLFDLRSTHTKLVITNLG